MQQRSENVGETWSMAIFPSRSQLQRFVAEVKVWNRVEGLPRIQFEVLADGTRMRFRSESVCLAGVRRYIDPFGAWIQNSV